MRKTGLPGLFYPFDIDAADYNMPWHHCCGATEGDLIDLIISKAESDNFSTRAEI